MGLIEGATEVGFSTVFGFMMAPNAAGVALGFTAGVATAIAQDPDVEEGSNLQKGATMVAGAANIALLAVSIRQMAGTAAGKKFLGGIKKRGSYIRYTPPKQIATDLGRSIGGKAKAGGRYIEQGARSAARYGREMGTGISGALTQSGKYASTAASGASTAIGRAGKAVGGGASTAKGAALSFWEKLAKYSGKLKRRLSHF